MWNVRGKGKMEENMLDGLFICQYVSTLIFFVEYKTV